MCTFTSINLRVAGTVVTLGARGFFLVGDDRIIIERQSREGKSRSGEKKTTGTNG